MKVVVEGCCHGELDKIYDVIGELKKREGLTVDLLICCGDFQAVRDKTDLSCMAVPPKYREMGSFYKYYSGEKTAPVLTIFIGGNHEASNHLWELSYGGWVAPNIYYMGTAGVVQLGGLRIAGLSGIYKEGDYRKGHFECPPFSEGTKRSIYHVRSCDVFRLKQLSGHFDIGLSHDWPLGIYHHGNKAQLLRKKTYFADEISQNTLGSPAAMAILQHLQPTYWFSAHLHVKFAAVYRHEETGAFTRFLALDKCLPGRRFLQVLDIPSPSPPPYSLCYDAEWLAILRSTEPVMSYSQSLWVPPHPSTDLRVSFTPTEAELKVVDDLFKGNLTVPNNFTANTTHHTSTPSHHHNAQPRENHQTTVFCQTLGIANPFTPNFRSHNASLCSHGYSAADRSNPDEIDLSSDDDHIHDSITETSTPALTSTPHKRSYPWLNNPSDDEQDPVSPTPTGLSSREKALQKVEAEDRDLSFAEVQKSLKSEFDSSETRMSTESCDNGVGSCDTGVESCDISGIGEICIETLAGSDTNPNEILLNEEEEEDEEGEGGGREGVTECDGEPMTSHIMAEDTRGMERRVLNLPQPKEPSLLHTTQEEKPDKSQMGGACDEATEVGSKVTQKSPVIKRRNLAMYQSSDDETSQ